MKPVPVAEVFGPTVQGEGELQGVPCYFVRLGGCDFKCSWCDTPHAVLPEEVRQLERLDEKGIMERLQGLEGSARAALRRFASGSRLLPRLSRARAMIAP